MEGIFECCQSGPVFPIPQGMLPWQPNLWQKLWQNYLPHCTYRSVISKWNGISLPQLRVNSINDASISCEDFVKFGPLTPELTGLVCERHVRHGQKTDAFRPS